MLSDYTNAEVHRFSNDFPTAKKQKSLPIDKSSLPARNAITKQNPLFIEDGPVILIYVHVKRLFCDIKTDKLNLETFVSECVISMKYSW